MLVDFGLAGRHIRPGCATGPYGAPEVWAVRRPASTTSPCAADVYAFGCLAFEALTGKMLFEAESEVAQITMHLAHDGFPETLRKLAQKPAAPAARRGALLDAAPRSAQAPERAAAPRGAPSPRAHARGGEAGRWVS